MMEFVVGNTVISTKKTIDKKGETVMKLDFELMLYDKAMEMFGKILKEKTGNEYDKWFDDVSAFQCQFMNLRFQKFEVKTEVDDVVNELFYYAVFNSQSGNSIAEIPKEDMVEQVKEKASDILGQYLLEPPEVYKENGKWYIDVTFGGNYVPYWDGWKEEEK